MAVAANHVAQHLHATRQEIKLLKSQPPENPLPLALHVQHPIVRQHHVVPGDEGISARYPKSYQNQNYVITVQLSG